MGGNFDDNERGIADKGISNKPISKVRASQNFSNEALNIPIRFVKNEKYPIVDQSLIERAKEIANKNNINNADFANILNKSVDFAYNVVNNAKAKLLFFLDNPYIAKVDYDKTFLNYFRYDNSNFILVINKVIEVCEGILTSDYGLKSEKVTYKSFSIIEQFFDKATPGEAGATTDPNQRTVTKLSDMIIEHLLLWGEEDDTVVATLIHETIHRTTNFANVHNAFDVYIDNKERFGGLKIDDQLINPDSYTHLYLELNKLS
jgi:hypothetical protein